jgi:hypothetical protein
MKLSEVSGRWYVATQKNKKKVFHGSKDECIRFIGGFDKASDDYVDLRLYDTANREFDYHKNEYAK